MFQICFLLCISPTLILLKWTCRSLCIFIHGLWFTYGIGRGQADNEFETVIDLGYKWTHCFVTNVKEHRDFCPREPQSPTSLYYIFSCTRDILLLPTWAEVNRFLPFRFLSYNVFAWFLNQGNAGLIRWIRKYSLLFNCVGEFV